MSYQPVILATGFEPFLGSPRNPSWEAVRQLPDETEGCRIVKRKLPVEWFRCVDLLADSLEELHPRMVISFGQGYEKLPILIERLGVNIGSGPDNTGCVDLREESLFPHAPAAYFSTFPYTEIHTALNQAGIEARYSFTAGQNQCNCVLYSALHFAATRFPGLTAGFVHVPMLPEPERGIQGVPLEVSNQAVRICVEECARKLASPVRTIEQYRNDL